MSSNKSNTKGLVSRYKATPHYPTIDFSFKNIESLDDPQAIFQLKPRTGKRAKASQKNSSQTLQSDAPQEQNSQRSSNRSQIERVARFSDPSSRSTSTSSERRRIRTNYDDDEDDSDESPRNSFSDLRSSLRAKNNDQKSSSNSAADSQENAVSHQREKPKYLGTALRLSENSIQSLVGLDETITTLMHHPEKLNWLDLSFNMIHSLEGLPLKYPLKALYLHGNQIDDIRQLYCLRHFKQLKSLTLHGCPISEIKNYRFQVLAVLPQLRKLDFTGVTTKDRETAQTFVKIYGNTFGR